MYGHVFWCYGHMIDIKVCLLVYLLQYTMHICLIVLAVSRCYGNSGCIKHVLLLVVLVCHLLTALSCTARQRDVILQLLT